jgi:hypothetical protein
MKRLFSTVGLTICLLALVVGASAQQTINFSNLPLVSTPSPVPSGYEQLDWGNFFYVNPYSWSEAGPGYKLGAAGHDVAFIGGLFCRLSGDTCFGTISNARGFSLVSANVAGGYAPALITVTAYNNGKYVGAQNYAVSTQMSTLKFPASWGVITQATIQVTGQTGDLVVYNLSLFTLGG